MRGGVGFVALVVATMGLVLVRGSYHTTTPGAHKTAAEDHGRTVSRLQDLIKSRPRASLTINRKPDQSHCARPHDYKLGSLQLDFTSLTGVLGVRELTIDDIPPHLRKTALLADDLAAIVDVQAMCSFETLVDALLPLGLIPAVVPEFKGITVGGSLQGLAAESTSFKYGFVHDAIVGFEALLGDGTVLWCSPTSNSELFYALPGSFGSIALCTRVHMLCIKAQPYVKVTCRQFGSQPECLAHMSGVQSAVKDRALSSTSPHMIEGLGFSKKSFASVEGTFVSSEEVDPNIHLSRCNQWGYPWFYNQVRECLRPSRLWSWILPWSTLSSSSSSSSFSSSSPSSSFLLPAKDYLFRHDRGSFWMASYRIPQFIGKWMGSLLDNSAMFRLANLLPWAFPKSQIVLQDFMLPANHLESFFNQSNEIASVWPIWLLPMRNFNSHHQGRKEKGAVFGVPLGETGDLCNVGVYGIPSGSYNHRQANKLLEAVLFQHGGRKVYYSHSYYDRDFFYGTLYDGPRYFDLRERYHANNKLPDIYEKVVVKNGKL